MNEILTPERVLEIGEEWTKILLQNLPTEKLNKLIAPEYKQGFIEQGIEQGIERGIERGIEQGIEQGIERGIEQGIERGIEQGIERGIEQGVSQKTREIIHAMHEKEFDLGVIADVIGLPLDTVQTLLSEQGTTDVGTTL